MNDTLIFGDSNVLMFRELHLQSGHRGWLPSAANPPLRKLDFEPETVVRMSWTSSANNLRTVNVYAFIGCSIGVLGKSNSVGDQIKGILVERRASPHRAVFFFGQADLDFVLWHALGRAAIDPHEFVRERAGKYASFILRTIGPQAAVTILGVHPITVRDEDLTSFFQKYGLEFPRFPRQGIEEFTQLCPAVAFESRLALRQEFDRELTAQCRKHGFEYLDIAPELCEGEWLKPEYRYSPTEVHVNLQNVLPVWLNKLSWLGSDSLDPHLPGPLEGALAG